MSSAADLEFLPAVRKTDAEERIRLLDSIRPRICEEYTKEIPHPTQQLFLLQNAQEVMFGGAAGGGKSSALLMSALQYADVPGYSALLLRRTWPDLSLPGAIMDRAGQWLRDTDASPREGGRTWVFPSGARITFGYLQYDKDKWRYQSAEFQFIGFDELTQFQQSTYEYMFSRLRRPNLVCIRCQRSVVREDRQWVHSVPTQCTNVTPDPKMLARYTPSPDGKTLFDVPLRVRSATNPGGVGHCVPYGEVLTPTGWSDISGLKVGDPVFEVLPDGTLHRTNVRQTHHHRAPWVRVEARGLTMALTHDHRVAKIGGTREEPGQVFTLVPWSDLPGQATICRTANWVGEPIGDIKVPRVTGRNNQPEVLTGHQYAAFMGWFLTEGSLVHRDKAISIAQKKPDGRRVIRALLDDCGFMYSENPHQFIIYASDWYQHLADYGFGLCRTKFVPPVLLGATASEIQAFLDAAIMGDGHRVTADSGQFYTTSARLADDVSHMLVKTGQIVHTSSRSRTGRDGLSYCVSFKRTVSGGTELLTGNHVYSVQTATKRRSKVTEMPETDVYCIGVDSHAFVIRQQGSVWISGNSWVRDRFIDPELRLPGAIFIPSTLADNPSLDAETYRENLAHLNPIDRERLMNGDWDVMEEGDFFQRHWFKFIREVPADTRIRWVRYWDVAATAEGDWTAGCLIGLTPDGEWIVADMRRMRGTPREVERFIHQTAVEDGVRVPIRMEQEPGSSGVMAIDHYRRNILVGYDFRPDKKTNDKQTRANPVSSAAEAGNISLLVGRWNRDFLDEVALFPHGANDDQCLSGDTILHTPDGPKPITEISAGDTVLGQTGWTRVLAAKMTSPAGVTTERFGIRATADHPVWTTRGWTPFLDVLDDDTLSTCCVSQTGVAVRQQRAGSVCAATNGSGVSAKGSNPNPSTPRVRSRVVPMGASTSRATAQSTTSVTESTATHCMSRGQSVGQSGWKPWSSTGSPSGDIQILPTRRTGDISSPVVSGLGKVSKPCTRKSGNSITEISQRGTTSITRMGISPTTPSTIWNAWSLRITGLSTPRTGRNALAHQNNWPTLTESGHLPLRGTGRQKVGSGTVNMQPSSARVEPVYNITTEDHTYYANGVLVHNCDALTGGFASLSSRRARLLA